MTKLTREQLVKECRMLRAQSLKDTWNNLESARWEIHWLKEVLRERLHNFKSWFDGEDSYHSPFSLEIFEVPFTARYLSKDGFVWQVRVDKEGIISIRKGQDLVRGTVLGTSWTELGE